MLEQLPVRSAAPAPAPTPPAPAGGWTLGAVSAATFTLILDVTVVDVALPDIQRSLGASFSQLQWVVDAYVLTLAVFLLAAATVADRLGRRRVFAAGTALFTAASLLCAAATTPLVLNLGRALEGVGGAVMYAVAPALIAHGFRGRRRAVAFCVCGGAGGLAVALGPVAGGALTGLGWRWIFLLNVPVGIVITAIVLTRVAESRDPRRRRLDWPGLAVFSLALTLLVLALVRGEAEGWSGALVLGLFAPAGVLLLAFVLIERRRRDALFDLALLRIRSFDGLAAATVAANAALMTAVLFQILYMQYVLGFSAYGAGVRYLPLALAVFLAALVSGTVAGRFPARLLVGVGCVAIGLGMLASDGLTAQSSWTDLLPGMLLAGFGMGTFNPVRAATAVALMPLSKGGMSSGMSETLQQCGVALGVAALGSVAHNRMHDEFTGAVARSGGLPDMAADRIAESVAAGRPGDAAGLVPPPDFAGGAADEVLVAGLDLVLRIGGVLAVAGGLVGFLLMRRRDFPAGPPGAATRRAARPCPAPEEVPTH
ncbi:MFS transporter [Streptomyces tagetis]|uniref:MFS transporter n=1 Tax=Streptomyces tagetis TaxID=2820809 RepID=A0A941AZU1_9ACTN|nr:MFS transporter [Streptomyces sp. RG38]MBQ0826555.1 MFS transporter [Streptomyces sp. RG38]